MKIVILDAYTLNPGDLSWDWLHTFGEVVIYDRTPAEAVVERARDAEVVFTNKTPVDGAALRALSRLRYIGVLATGYNIVDVATAKELGIIVSNAPAYGTASVVQHTFALLLELCVHIQRHSDSVYAGDWCRSPDFSYTRSPLVELSGKTMGIVGFGDIGRKVGEVATAFGMKVLATGRQPREPRVGETFEWVGLEELLRRSDVVSLHCPLTPDTKGMIHKERLRMMKQSAFLLNTSRGLLIVEEDLAEALDTGVIAGAGLDVLSQEPPRSDNPLLRAKNCLITPHIAWATQEARSRMMAITQANLAAFAGGRPLNVVNP